MNLEAPHWLHRTALFCVLASATLFAACWALRVPYFEQPDELSHADYAFALADVARPFALANPKQGHPATPDVTFLAQAVGYRRNRYASVVRLPSGYGSRAYFTELDHNAPARFRLPPVDSRIPNVMFAYPAGYYCIAALAMNAAALAAPRSITTQMFAARLVGVACLPLTLLLAYGILLRLRLTRSTALLGTTAVAFTPVTLWVSGYVQPDVLSTLLFTATVYSSLRWKGAPTQLRWPAILGTVLIALACVKQHYAAIAVAATALAAVCTQGIPRRRNTLALVFIPPIAAVFAVSYFTPAGKLGTPRLSSPATLASPIQRLGTFAGDAIAGLRETYTGGAFQDFWLRYGLHGGSVAFPGWYRMTSTALLVGTAAMLLLFVLRTRYVFGRIFRVCTQRSPLAAMRLIFGDAILNTYVMMTALLVALYAASGGVLWLEGRYWLPVIAPLAGIALARSVRFRPIPMRRSAGACIAGLWASYGLIAAPLGISSIERTYYHTTSSASRREAYAAILSAHPQRGCDASTLGASMSVDGACSIDVTGYAIDGSRGGPATDVFLTLDGKRVVRAQTGLVSPYARDAYNDDTLARAGFQADLDIRGLKAGAHTVGLSIFELGDFRFRYASTSVALHVRG